LLRILLTGTLSETLLSLDLTRLRDPLIVGGVRTKFWSFIIFLDRFRLQVFRFNRFR